MPTPGNSAKASDNGEEKGKVKIWYLPSNNERTETHEFDGHPWYGAIRHIEEKHLEDGERLPGHYAVVKHGVHEDHPLDEDDDTNTWRPNIEEPRNTGASAMLFTGFLLFGAGAVLILSCAGSADEQIPKMPPAPTPGPGIHYGSKEYKFKPNQGTDLNDKSYLPTDRLQAFPNFPRNMAFLGNGLGKEGGDLSSAAAAIAAAYMYQGVPVVMPPLAPTAKFVLDKFSVREPFFYGAPDNPVTKVKDQKWVLVDTSGSRQGNWFPNIPLDKRVGLIGNDDAHETIDPMKGEVEVRPWGSVCSIICNMFSQREIEMPQWLAGIMLSAVITDTDYFRSPYTTQYDLDARSALGFALGFTMEDQYDELATQIFEVRTKTAGQSAEQIVGSDVLRMLKGPIKYAWAEVQTLDTEKFLKDAPAYQAAMEDLRAKDGVDLVFFSVTSIEVSLHHLRTVVFYGSKRGLKYLKRAFPKGKLGSVSGTFEMDATPAHQYRGYWVSQMSKTMAGFGTDSGAAK